MQRYLSRGGVAMSERSGGMNTLRRFPIVYGFSWSLFLAVLGTLLVSLWAHFANLSDTHVTIAAYIVHCVAVLFGAIGASRCAKERGWYYGGLTGLLYAVVMVLIGVVVYNTFTFDASGLFRVLVMALIGAFGGIIGINTVRQ